MDNLKKLVQIRIRIDDTEVEQLKAMADASRLAISDVATIILHAGLTALRQNKNRMTLPLAFAISDGLPSTRQEITQVGFCEDKASKKRT